jgi:CCR4-NOT transcription complex subunit 7/8
MYPTGAFHHHPQGQPFAVATTAPSYYAPTASHPAAVAMQAPPAALYRATVPITQVAPRPFGVTVRSVWAENLGAAQIDMGYFAAHARCVAVKVHYPGVVVHSTGGHDPVGGHAAEKRYAVVKANVDALKPLQVGLAVCTDDGRVTAWEFNLSDFDPAADPHATQSLLHLQSRGLSCFEHRHRGIPMEELSRLLRFSGLVGNRPGVSWVTHTGAYHLAYLMKVINGGKPLAGDMDGFLGSVRRSLGEDVYDVASMAADCPDMPVGLEHIAAKLRLPPPVSTNALAGAGSVLALEAFLKLKPQTFGDNVARYRGVLQGLHTI